MSWASEAACVQILKPFTCTDHPSFSFSHKQAEHNPAEGQL